ncbi:MAG TPA: M56 family metallopeptidase [Thermoanaerobaculia bacterium]|jgi:beta-lactamase regulating signal transducer with metallopeptidase domain|nr:M56 family metallopeptidase [Thermoanaerobaculia bacterium]
MIAHFLESTLLLAMAILIAHMPRLAAKTRYAIVFAALLKFAIPSAMVPRMLALAGIDLARIPKGTILIDALGPLVATNLPATNTPIWPLVALALWLVIAIALLARALVRGRAGMRLALFGAFDADTRALTVLTRARARAGVTRALRLVRSPITTPATVRLLQPVILIPAGTQLADAELETILTHECAHIARHDNLLGIIETIAGCALWFHPLVWIARRVLDAAREEACDAIVIASGDPNVYVTALGKVCGAVIAPRAAGISCIVSNTIQERMEAIMRFGTRRLLPHRLVTSAALALLAVATIGIGVAHALPSAGKDAQSSISSIETPVTRAIPSSAKPGRDKISLDLKDADIRDVLHTFAQLTNTEILADADVSGSVTISVHDIPWQEAFAKILDDANLRQERVGETIHVHRK